MSNNNKILTVKSPSGSILLVVPDGNGGIIYRQLDGSLYTGVCNNLEMYCCDGADGADGAPGANGSNGTNGADGADGLSAYEVAVANGFVGNEAAWLASLVGADGAPGANGANGAPGANGSNGTNGADGADGSKWYNGSSSPDVGLSFIGVDGDYYLNISNGDVYNKVAGTWTLIGNINGECEEPICDRVWIQIDFFSIGHLKLYIDTFGVSFTITQIEWQIFTGSIWEKIKIGGTTLVPNDPGVTDGYDVDCGDNDKPIRIKFTDDKGCIHYSNLARLQCP